MLRTLDLHLKLCKHIGFTEHICQQTVCFLMGLKVQVCLWETSWAKASRKPGLELKIILKFLNISWHACLKENNKLILHEVRKSWSSFALCEEQALSVPHNMCKLCIRLWYKNSQKLPLWECFFLIFAWYISNTCHHTLMLDWCDLIPKHIKISVARLHISSAGATHTCKWESDKWLGNSDCEQISSRSVVVPFCKHAKVYAKSVIS